MINIIKSNKTVLLRVLISIKMLMLLSKTIIACCIILITSCSSNVKSKWQCPATKGLNCASIAVADNLNNNIDKNNKSLIGFPIKNNLKAEVNNFANTNNNINIANGFSSNKLSINYGNHINGNLRNNDQVSRIWFAPFTDSDDNLHSESLAYIIDKQSSWQWNNF